MTEKSQEELKVDTNASEDDGDMNLTPSADDILGVSPVPSMESARTNASTPPPPSPPRRPPRKPPMTQLPSTKVTVTTANNSEENTTTEKPSPPRFRTTVRSTADDDDDDEQQQQPASEQYSESTKTGRSTLSDSAFSSSSEEDDDASITKDALAAYDDPPSSKDTNRRSNAAAPTTQQQSDDPNRSEFDKALMKTDGVPNVGSASFDVSKDEFLSQAEYSVINEAMSMDESYVEESQSPERSQQQGRVPRPPRTSAQGATSPANSASLPPPPPAIRNTMSWQSKTSDTASTMTKSSASTRQKQPQPISEEDLSAGVLPDVLMNMRQRIESLSLFDSDMMRLAQGDLQDDDIMLQETRETLKRSSQQSISPAVLVSLAHKRYERRRLAAMEIEKVIRGLAHQGELERVRAILLLLSDDYVRSTSEDARKGGVVGLAACAIGLKKASDDDPEVMECRDLILASVVHACQDHQQRVRYYATESLFNVVKVIPALAVQHFFILFEILRSLYADVDADVRSGAEFLDKKLKDVIVGAINSGSFTADACVPIFARFVYMRNKATKRLTLTWLQELNEKLIGSPVLEFLHLFLSGIFAMVADPSASIRQSALAFLQSVLPKLLADNAAFDDKGASMMKIEFDKILQSLVTTMEHPDPFVRKVAMYWISRIVKAHMSDPLESGEKDKRSKTTPTRSTRISAASMSVRNSLPHMLPGVLLSIGDTFHSRTNAKDAFLPDLTTRSLAEQTNTYLQHAVRRDGEAYVPHLDGFIVALREELDSPGGMNARNPPAVERKPYRMDVTPDGTGIESPGWFRASLDEKGDESIMMSRLCALEWVVVLYESVVPDALKAEYAREFITSIIHQLVDSPPEAIIFKSLEVLSKITVPVLGEQIVSQDTSTNENGETSSQHPMTDANAQFALDVLDSSRRQSESRDRQVFKALIRLHADHHQLVGDLSRVIQYMCTLQSAEFVFISFALELDLYVRRQTNYHRESRRAAEEKKDGEGVHHVHDLSADLEFVSSFIQQMNHVLLNTEETKELRDLMKDCVSSTETSTDDHRKKELFHILLHSFSHNLASTLSLCLWGGAYRTASTFLYQIDPLDISLIFLVEVDKLVEMLERPLFRHLHVRMLECDANPGSEGSGYHLFQTLKSLLMLVPQSTCYRILRDRLVSLSRFRQSALAGSTRIKDDSLKTISNAFVSRVLEVRRQHCDARWEEIRADSLETSARDDRFYAEEGERRREWLGYATKEEEDAARARFREEKRRLSSGFSIEEINNEYKGFDSIKQTKVNRLLPNNEEETDAAQESLSGATDAVLERQPSDEKPWKQYWENAEAEAE